MKKLRMDLEYKGIKNAMTKDDNWAHHEYKATLKYGSRQLTTPFYTGMKWIEEPTEDDVLYALIMDAQSVEYEPDFEGWAASLGYDPDSRKAEKIYNNCIKTGKKLEKLLGNDYASFQKKYENY